MLPKETLYENLVYDEAARYSLGGVRDAPISLGDRVCVFGLGALGQMAVQLAKLGGASWVAASDPVPARREAAMAHPTLGADVVYAPTVDDVGVEVKLATENLGVSVALPESFASRLLLSKGGWVIG